MEKEKTTATSTENLVAELEVSANTDTAENQKKRMKVYQEEISAWMKEGGTNAAI